MKKLLASILTTIGSLLVFTPVIVFGFFYSFAYSLWSTITLKDWKAFFIFWYKIFNGVLSAIGYILHGFAIGFDRIGNVIGGEMIEDAITHIELTKLGDKDTTISASIGELELRDEPVLNGRGIVLSRCLNVVFNQKQHAKDSWLIHKKRQAIESQFFKPRKKR